MEGKSFIQHSGFIQNLPIARCNLCEPRRFEKEGWQGAGKYSVSLGRNSKSHDQNNSL